MDEDRLYAQDYSLAPEWAPAIDSSDNSDQDNVVDTAYPLPEEEIDPILTQEAPLEV